MISSSPPARRTHGLAQDVFDFLVEQIRSGALRPGDRLPTEVSLMQSQGVSRTVVREALQRLQASGLVETRHGIGSFVLQSPAPALDFRSPVAKTQRDVVAILELRICIETESAGLAAQRATRQDLADIKRALDAIDLHARAGDDAAPYDFQFHLQIARATDNPYFVDVLSHLDPAIAPRARLDPASYMSRVNSEHINIYEAIARRDPEGARAAMRTHLSNSRERLKQAWRVGQGDAI